MWWKDRFKHGRYVRMYMYKRREFLSASASAGVVVVSGCVGESNSGSDNGGSDNGGSSESLEEKYPNHAAIYEEKSLVVLRPIESDVNSVSVNISGTIVNASDQDYEYVQITLGLYDGRNTNGRKIGNVVDNISGLESGQKWGFEAVGSTPEGLKSFGLDDITAY